VETLKAQVAQSSGMSGDDMVKAALARVPLGRVLNPDEIAALIKQLLFCKFRFLFWGCGVSTPSQGFMFR